MAKTDTDAAWAAEHQQRARADRLAAMVETRDATIDTWRAEVAARDGVIKRLRRRVERVETDNGKDVTVNTLRADLAARDKRIAELAASRDNEINILANSIAANAETIAKLRADVAERDATIAQLRADHDECDEDDRIAYEHIQRLEHDSEKKDRQIQREAKHTKKAIAKRIKTIKERDATIATLRDRSATLWDVNDKLRARVLELEDKYEPAPVLGVNLSGFEGEEAPTPFD